MESELFLLLLVVGFFFFFSFFFSEPKNLTDKVVLGLESLQPQPSECWGHCARLTLWLFRLTLTMASKEALVVVTRSTAFLPLRRKWGVSPELA